MRLKNIKLAGFKSFVDPTTVPLPGHLMAVVGPNGCGKSNIIDAVRWVMGESSAKHLRGGSMADVIFNGSSRRKPVGNATIELVFDNSDGSLGGQYAAYAEIAAKRQVNRDGQSVYSLNGTRCRKRDITDVFLGTGLGPRSYSIIEQGMISQIIEARSDDLRAYLEEAAGISLYKERRRETERRLRDTAENLERLDDVRDEVTSRLERLQRQAEAAERYKALKAEQRTRQAELYVLRLRQLEAERESLRRALTEKETAREGEMAQRRELEREIEAVHARHTDDSDHVNQVQARYYALGAEIARVEQRIAHQRELRESGDRELAQSREAAAELTQELQDDQRRLDALDAHIAALEPALAAAGTAAASAQQALAENEAALDEWRARWEAFNRRIAEPVQVAEVERARIEQLDRREREVRDRLDRLAREAEGLATEAIEAELTELDERENSLNADVATRRDHVQAATARLAELDEGLTAGDDELAARRAELAREQGRLSSLQTLQSAALDDDQGIAGWLRRFGLEDTPRLARRLEVAPGWEHAVETALGGALQALVCGAQALPPPAALSELEHGSVTLVAADMKHPEVAPGGSELARQVSGHPVVAELLRGVHGAEDATQAEALLARLAPGESVISRNGVWLGHDWRRMHAGASDAEGGVLERERQIADVSARIAELERLITRVEDRRAAAREERDRAREARDAAATQLSESEQALADVTARRRARHDRAQELSARAGRIAAERDDLNGELTANDNDLTVARQRLSESLEASERLERERSGLDEERQRLEAAVNASRDNAAATREAHQQRALEVERTRSDKGSLAEGIARSRTQLERLQAQQQALQERLSALGDPDEDLEQERQTLLEQRLGVEEELSAARGRLGEAETRLRELESARGEADRRVAEMREALENTRFRDHELKIRAQTQGEQLDEMHLERATVEAEMPAQAEDSAWVAELERLAARIQRLGAINLAAIEEREQLAERKGYLDAQHADLSEAMETLQTAIRRIDRETRERFRATFDKANTELQRLFPRLFGGGEAYLEMTGEDLLETGVTIMARPPGKKISNIHLLSGGEKALSAVALVFALFELNPAPFCMLDEVDAPLDDANVGRFCDLLGEMSARVQFIVITHNKTTMEAASHLTGVTMNEPGVSRLVAVDVGEAAELASA